MVIKIPYFIKIIILKINLILQKLNNRKKYLKLYIFFTYFFDKNIIFL